MALEMGLSYPLVGLAAINCLLRWTKQLSYSEQSKISFFFFFFFFFFGTLFPKKLYLKNFNINLSLIFCPAMIYYEIISSVSCNTNAFTLNQ